MKRFAKYLLLVALVVPVSIMLVACVGNIHTHGDDGCSHNFCNDHRKWDCQRSDCDNGQLPACEENHCDNGDCKTHDVISLTGDRIAGVWELVNILVNPDFIESEYYASIKNSTDLLYGSVWGIKNDGTIEVSKNDGSQLVVEWEYQETKRDNIFNALTWEYFDSWQTHRIVGPSAHGGIMIDPIRDLLFIDYYGYYFIFDRY